MNAIYKITLPQFEGPFDLLIYFIERDELDIYDIPIAKLSDDFLAYLHQLEQMDIELGGEFVLMAATLMRIKAKMLLPRKELDEAGNEIDPRTELVEKIIEYKTFKEVLATLQTMEDERQQKTLRGNIGEENDYISEKYSTESELESITLFKLLSVFNKIMTRFDDRQKEVQVSIKQIPYNIPQQRAILTERLQTGVKMTFEDIFSDCRSRYMAIVRFLALLELTQERFIKIIGGQVMNSFWVVRRDAQDNEADETDSEVDDGKKIRRRHKKTE